MRTINVLAVACALLISLSTAPSTNAQLIIADVNSGGETAASLAALLIGGGTASVVGGTENLIGDTECAGSFIDPGGTTTGLTIAGGVVLGSGRVLDAVGPNVSDSTTTFFGTAGDQFLTDLQNVGTFDACVLEFDFDCPFSGDAAFNYQFTSEEYNEFTNSTFTNVFGWQLNGTNIALLPDGVTPVAINTVNGGNPGECSNFLDDDGDGPIDAADSDCTAATDNIVGELNSNSSLYQNNDCSDPDGGAACPLDIEADGLTVTLTASGAVLAGPNNTIRLAIGDAGDAILDSWAFLEEGSFECIPRVKTDLKPGSNPNCTNLDKGGLVSVAVFGGCAGSIPLDQINVGSVEFGGAPALRAKPEDVPMEGPAGVHPDVGDGIDDLVFKFKKSDMDEVGALGPDGCVEVELRGFLLDGTQFKGSDILCVPGGDACNASTLQDIPQCP